MILDSMDVSPFTLVIALASRYLTSWLRKVPWFGAINADSKGKVHAVNASLAAVLTVVALVLTGQLTEATMTEAVNTVFNVIMAFSGSTALYEIEKSVTKPRVVETPTE